MDQYLENFLNYLREKTGDELCGLIIYGSYVKGYFDEKESDYDVFVIFKNEIIDIKKDISEKFPKISLQLYTNLEGLKAKIVNGGWNTYIVFVYTGKILFQTKELTQLRNELMQFKPNINNLTTEQKNGLLEKLKADTVNSNTLESYPLNKFLYSSLLRKLQILYFLRTNNILLEFNSLLSKLTDDFVRLNFEWLSKLEDTVFSRNKNLIENKQKYIEILSQADLAIKEILI